MNYSNPKPINMKKITLLIVLSIIIQTTGFSQPCPDSIGFTSQAQIDSFQINFPNCTEIEGLVFIGDIEYDTDINNLEGLSALTSIGGGLMIAGTSYLTNLTGLDNLTSVGGSISLGVTTLIGTAGNSGLTSLSGLESLHTIGAQLTIKSAPNLTNLSGLQNLTSIYSLHIENNQSLTDISGIENINAGTISVLNINNNISLSTCNVKSICDYLGTPNAIVFIHDNASGCNTPEEIEEACSSCLPEGIIFTTQEQIDNFQTDYPGCTEIEGNVIIEESDIINLNGLSVLTSIGGSLVVYGNNALTNFTGLEGLTTIGNCLEFFRNDSLTSLSGLEGLTTIGGYLSIGLNDIGLPGNQSLISLEGLSNLISVGTKLEVLGNPSLTSLSGLDNIEAVSIQSISIAGNNSLSTCEVKSICDYLVSPNGSINIYDNAPGCNSPEEVEQECMSHCLPEGITFTTQTQIDSFAINNPGCTEIEGDVIVAGNDITNLNGLNVIVSVGGDLSVHNNAILTSLSGLDNLTSIGGYLEISRNDSLSSLVGLRNVTAIGESVYIGSHDILWGGNPTLTNLNGLEGLTSIEGDLYISLNIALVSLSGLDNLISIGGSLSVRYTALNSLEGLEKLTSIEGILNVDSNGILTSLTGLENIDAGSIIYLSIYNNELLSTCEVQSICDYLVAPNGEVSIYNNAPGCNSQQEVEEACASFIADTEGDYDISMYPNPVSTNAILGGEFGSCKTIHICLYNTTGICLKSWEFKNQQSSQQEFTLNVSNLPPGIYFLRLQAGNEVVTKKVVKL